MSKVTEARAILKGLGLPSAQQNEISALTLLALANVRKRGSWSDVKQPELRIHDVLGFSKDVYGKTYAENTRETIRRQVVHQFVQAGIVVINPSNPELPTNSPKTMYALSPRVKSLLKTYGTAAWKRKLHAFLAEGPTLQQRYSRERNLSMVSVTTSDGEQLLLSPGRHNHLQAAVLMAFVPRFCGGAALVYFGDTAKKNLHHNDELLKKLGIPFSDHDKLPDIILYEPKKERLFLIEAVTSHGPVSPKRQEELEKILSKCPATRVYITAFPTLNEFKRHAANIAWETEVWISEIPGHMIHFNGNRFL